MKGNNNKGGDRETSREERQAKWDQEQTKRRELRIKKAGEPDTQVINAKTTMVRSLAWIADQADWGIRMLVDRMTDSRVELDQAVPLIKEFQETSRRLSEVTAKIHEAVGGHYRRPKYL